MKVHALPTCPTCHGAEFRTFDLGDGNFLRRCVACDTVSASEYADPSEIYVDGYMLGGVGDFGLDVRDPVFQQYLARVADRRMGFIEKATGVRGGTLLDVGSGTGEVLVAARDRGWTVQGCEPESTGAEFARERGLPVEVALLEESGLPEGHYDVVSAFHVLEHVPDSVAFLQTLRRWARPGGFVTIEVPNFNSVLRRRLGQDWPHLRKLEHIVHHTPTTLQRAFREAGLEPVMVRSPAYVGPPQTLDLALTDLVRHGRKFRALIEPLSREQNGERYPTRAGWAVLQAMDAVYDRAGVGAVVFCVGRVP